VTSFDCPSQGSNDPTWVVRWVPRPPDTGESGSFLIVSARAL